MRTGMQGCPAVEDFLSKCPPPEQPTECLRFYFEPALDPEDGSDFR
jgi:hypothetical protein